MSAIPLSRRVFLTCSSASLLSACVTCGEGLPDIPADPSKLISDAHTHFFNATDLPVAGFIKFVIIRDFIGDLPEIALAIVDIFINFIKPFAVTIKQEHKANLSKLNTASFDEGISAEGFGSGLKAQIENSLPAQQKSWASLDAENQLEDSYQALAFLLSELENIIGDRVPESLMSTLDVNESFLTEIARGRIDLSDQDSRELIKRTNDQGAYGQGIFSSSGETNKNGQSGIANILDILRWAFLMMKSRCYHVNQYIEKMSSQGLRPGLVVNLLVDYDEWLNDDPSPGSSHLQQIKFWHDYASKITDKINIKTFAGYDPLKHVYQLKEGGKSHFEQMVELYNAGKLSGFKVYPPMGFKAIGNAGQEFSAQDGIKDLVSGKWRERYPNLDLGEKLDEALMNFYDVCVGDNAYGRPIPILAHGGNSNAPASNFGERANPEYWFHLISQPKYSKLRLCLGHFTDAPEFIQAMEHHIRNDFTSSDLWTLQYSAKMIAMSAKGEADIYADIGYMPELLSASGSVSTIAVDFFEALFKFCEYYDPDCKSLMYGSDWIMLGIENNHQNYVATIERAMNLTQWGHADNKEMKRNFLTNNLRRFLYLDSI